MRSGKLSTMFKQQLIMDIVGALGFGVLGGVLGVGVLRGVLGQQSFTPSSEEVMVEVINSTSPSTVKVKIGENGKVVTIEVVEQSSSSEVMGTSTTEDSESSIEERKIQDQYNY